MKIFAQQGYGPKDKLVNGLNDKIIAGAILSPRYVKPERMPEKIKELQENGGQALIDPELYATDFIAHPTPNLGALEEWDYFTRPKRSALISGTAIPGLVRGALEAQINLGVDELIAPNLYIRQADSIDTAVALNFLNQTKAVSSELSDKPVYGTIAVHRDAMLDGNNFKDILDGLTGLDTPPDGYYIIAGSSEQQSSGNFIRSDLYKPEIIAGWMYTNYALSINGAKVINGYCFLLSTLMGICGASASASGWSSGLRKFCIDRYARSQNSGGRQPGIRYLSAPLLSYIRQTDYEVFSALAPEIRNDLATDAPYQNEPTRTEEALQAWDGLNNLSQTFCNPQNDILTNLNAYNNHLNEAAQHWRTLGSAGISGEVEANIERLEAIADGIELFKEWAELA